MKSRKDEMREQCVKFYQGKPDCLAVLCEVYKDDDCQGLQKLLSECGL